MRYSCVGSRFWGFGEQRESKASSVHVLRFGASRPSAHLHLCPLIRQVVCRDTVLRSALISVCGTQSEPVFDLAINGAGCREGQTILLEPTVEAAIRRSQCPVLTVGSHLYDSADGNLKNIVYATDFSPESLEASRYALSLAQEFQARLTLLHVVEGLEPTLLDEKAQIGKPYKLWLGKLVPDEARLWCELQFLVEFGRPAERILQVAWENHADLVVLGARGVDRLTTPGLNVRKVMCNAWCPVLTVSGALDSHKQERFWRAAAAASNSQEQELIEEAI